VEVVASLSQGRRAAAQCGLFTHKSVPVIFEPPCNCRENKNTNFVFSNFFFLWSKIVPFTWKNILGPGRTHDNMTHAYCMLDTYGYRHTPRICNIYCLHTATMITRTRLNFVLYVY